MVRSTETKGGFNFEPTLEMSSNSTNLEFHKGKGTNRGSRNRTALGKPTPSKWDDAQKWLVGLSLRVGDRGQAITKPRNSNADDRRLITHVPQKEKDSSSSSTEEGIPTTKIQDEGETKKVDCNETFWQINKPSEDSSSSAILSVCVRDMGTEMTPIASQEPSRTGTPLRATTPACRSPISSRFYSPEICHQTGQTSFENKSEDMVVSRAGGATKWSNQEDEESKSCKIHENKKSEQTRKPNPLETRAMAWDEAECAKYMARYKREEVKIQAWENHQKIKAEMEMRRMAVKAERLKSRAQEKLVNKLASTRRIAEERRANAEAKLTEQAVRTSEKADYIRRTGHLPSTFSFKLPSLCW